MTFKHTLLFIPSALPEFLTHLPTSSFFPSPLTTFRISTISTSLILSFACLKTTSGSHDLSVNVCQSQSSYLFILNAHCSPRYTCFLAKQHVFLFTHTSMLFHVHTFAHADSSSWNDHHPLPSPLSLLISAYQKFYLIYV